MLLRQHRLTSRYHIILAFCISSYGVTSRTLNGLGFEIVFVAFLILVVSDCKPVHLPCCSFSRRQPLSFASCLDSRRQYHSGVETSVALSHSVTAERKG
jgi:hypothetical protein